MEMGVVKIAPREIPEDDLQLPLKQVQRVATVDDIRRLNENTLKEQNGFKVALEKIAHYDLPMKLIMVEYTFDRSRMVFHFSAENRVDFRELAKDLARTLKTRVELHQIGVRDEAKMLGGLGSCGKELCCASFLTEFEPVGIKMAKEQELSLNPQKISGVCGRLMCCLAYEFHCYKHTKRYLPRTGTKLETSKGPGKVIEIDVPKEEVVVELSEGGRLRLDKAGLAACGWQPKAAPEEEIVETAEPEDHLDIIPEELIEE